jgi:hypothetical protein
LVYPVAMHFFWPQHLSCPKSWPAFPTSDGVAPLFMFQWVAIKYGWIVDYFCNFK